MAGTGTAVPELPGDYGRAAQSAGSIGRFDADSIPEGGAEATWGTSALVPGDLVGGAGRLDTVHRERRCSSHGVSRAVGVRCRAGARHLGFSGPDPSLPAARAAAPVLDLSCERPLGIWPHTAIGLYVRRVKARWTRTKPRGSAGSHVGGNRNPAAPRLVRSLAAGRRHRQSRE